MSIREFGKYEGDRSILAPRKNYKGFTVEVRPSKWREKIWIGKIETLERAKLVADAVRHYVGNPPSHFEEGVMMLPAITCIGTSVELSTREMCAKYVSEIAKGEVYKYQRVEFIQSVKNVVRHPDFPFLARPRTDVVVLDSDDRDREDEFVFDEDATKALEMFPHSGSSGVPVAVVQTHVAGPDSCQFHDFEPMVLMSKPEFSIDSGGMSGSSSGTTSWRYKGVSHRLNKWVAEIRVPDGNKGNVGMRIRLGEYRTRLEAAFAYDVAVMCLGGGESMRNFHHPIYEQIPRILPDLSPWSLMLECRNVVREFLELAKEAGNSEMFRLKSDETYFKMLQEEIAKLSYISRLLSQGDEFEQNLTNIGKTSFFLYFNEMDNVFEFYFKNYQGMASIIGVGLECAKVVLEDGWKIIVQEISKPSWNDAWKNFDSSSNTMKVTIPEPLEEGMDNKEDSQASIPRGQCLLLDLAQYFILRKAIASFLSRASMTHANNDSSTNSSPSNQDIAGSSSNSDQLSSRFFQTVKNILFSRENSSQVKTNNGDGIPMDLSGDDDVKIDTIVHLKLLPGGDLFDGNNPLDATLSHDKELETLTSQLENTICLEMTIKFLKEGERKEIQVIVGPITFDFLEKNEVNFEKNGRFGWYHKSLEVSFGPINASHSDIDTYHKAHDIIDWKLIKTTESSDATTHETSKLLNGKVKGSVPHILTILGGGSLGWSNSSSSSNNVGRNFEIPSQMTRGGFFISPRRHQRESILKYCYRALYNDFHIDLQKLVIEDYRKFNLSDLPMCIPQDVKFEGTWHPKELQGNPQALVEYSIIACRKVYMTSKCDSEKDVGKSRTTKSRHSKIQKASNEPLNYTQKYPRRFFLNHAMTHLNGEKFKIREFFSNQSLNHMGPQTYLEDQSCYVHKWHTNPLVELNST